MSIFDFYLEMLVSWEWYVCALLAPFMLALVVTKLHRLKVDPPIREEAGCRRQLV